MASDSAANHTSSAAGRYAVALYTLAAERNAVTSIAPQMDRLSQIIQASPDFRRLLQSPLFDVRESSKAVRAVLDANEFGPVFKKFVGLVAANRRLALLPAIIAAWNALIAEKRGIQTAEVTTAYQLTDLERAALAGRLAEAGYGSVNLVETVDPNILGGLIVKIGSRLYDTSLKSRLHRLQYAMKGAA